MTTQTAIETTAIETLAAIISEHGAIPTIRVSSAQARGAAKRYSYWGAARYELRLLKDGSPANMATERASSDRRVERLAYEDASKIATNEGRIHVQGIGRVSERLAAAILADLAEMAQAEEAA